MKEKSPLVTDFDNAHNHVISIYPLVAKSFTYRWIQDFHLKATTMEMIDRLLDVFLLINECHRYSTNFLERNLMQHEMDITKTYLSYYSKLI